MNNVLLQIPLDIPDVKIEKFTKDSQHQFVVTVTSTCKSAECRKCHKTIEKFYGYDKEITLRHLPIFATPVWIKIKPKRFQCPDCEGKPTTTQQCSWYDVSIPRNREEPVFLPTIKAKCIISTLLHLLRTTFYIDFH